MQRTEMTAIALLLAGLLLVPVLSMKLRRRFTEGWVSPEEAKGGLWSREFLLGNLIGILYVVSLMAVAFGINRSNSPMVVLGVVVGALIGIGGIWHTHLSLRMKDELVRKVETEALALAFGLTLVGVVASESLIAAELVSDRGIWGVLRVMFLSYLFARFMAYWRYR